MLVSGCLNICVHLRFNVQGTARWHDDLLVMQYKSSNQGMTLPNVMAPWAAHELLHFVF